MLSQPMCQEAPRDWRRVSGVRNVKRRSRVPAGAHGRLRERTVVGFTALPGLTPVFPSCIVSAVFIATVPCACCPGIMLPAPVALRSTPKSIA